MDFCFTKERIESTNYDQFYSQVANESSREEFFGKCGNTHYRFLAYISTFFNNTTIFDFSTDCGLSALALSYNRTNRVRSYCNKSLSIFNIQNINFDFEMQVNDDFLELNREELLNSSLIFIDLHPHEGTIEYKMLDFLRKNNYQGLIVFDDIWYFKTMRDNLWYKIEEQCRFDVTEFSHWSGCGLVSFNAAIQNKFMENKADVSNWTLVTAYFNLTKCNDASNEIRARDKNFYIGHSYATLCLPYNLVIYCDEESYDVIKKIRPEYLNDKTHYKICDFEDFGFVKNGTKCREVFFDYRQQIIENRQNFPYHFDNRNTASYYLFCMARYAMLKEVITENLFKSTHFGWINFCIERMGFMNLIHLEECLAVNRNKFSTCYIDYIPESLIKNTKEYFKWGRCSMCSGFFTGNAWYMYKVCDLIENKFLSYLEMGYGHADEQLYSPVYFENIDLFEHYYGDYQQMITNYKYIYDAPQPPVHNFIRNSFLNKNYKKCLEACKFVMESIRLGKCVLDDNYTQQLKNYYDLCSKNLNAINIQLH